ncbi:MAG: prephenate dehydrogenase/arogenate dehydrogenase family protein [Actinobacteria bacterium]|nr:prephenate dehydrogenase/arogenate dehydrogenase family protein [Actinomycetota bacterium]
MADPRQHSGIHRLAVIGVGLMGGSLALAAQARAAVDQVVGYDADPAVLEEALRLGVITEKAANPAEAAAYADLAVVAAPVRSIPGLVEECAVAVPPPRLISDMGSTKSAIIAALSPTAKSLFIGGHPICGAATSGVRYAREDLFAGATYFLCTTGAAFPKLYEMLQRFLLDIGAKPSHIDAMAHDRIMAVVSHLPHVVANVLMEHAGGFQVGGRKALHCVGPSFKDLTRVAGANPPMWRDIFLENREALADSLATMIAELEDFRSLLQTAGQAEIEASIHTAAIFREELLELEDIVPRTLYRVTVHIPDQPGVLSKVMTTLGEHEINVEDLTLHHVSRSVGGDLILYVAGEETAETAASLLHALGYPSAVSLMGDVFE